MKKKILLSITIAVFITACTNHDFYSYNDLAEDAVKSLEYSPDCVAYAKPINSNIKITQEGYTRFIVKLEACKTREMFDGFAN